MKFYVFRSSDRYTYFPSDKEPLPIIGKKQTLIICEDLSDENYNYETVKLFLNDHTGFWKPRDFYEIELSSIDELIAFTEKYGKVIIDKVFCKVDNDVVKVKTIEIYDDYRE